MPKEQAPLHQLQAYLPEGVPGGSFILPATLQSTTNDYP